MTILRPLLILAACLPCAIPLKAAPLTVRVTDEAGRPVRDAVVIVRPVGRAAPAPRRATGIKVEQRDLQFHPFVTVVPLGSSVSFPNFDQTRHHVYSFSAAKKFELKLFASEQSRSVTFDKAGVVAVGCNIHDQMSAFLYVTDSAWTAKSEARGAVSFGDAPAGTVTVTVFHPYLRSPGNMVARTLSLSAAGGATTIPLKLRAPPPMMMHGY